MNCHLTYRPQPAQITIGNVCLFYAHVGLDLLFEIRGAL